MFGRELKKHKLDYSLLLLGLAVILFIFWSVWPETEQQKLCILALGVFYSAWGIWHHWREKTIHTATVIEYIGMSIFACLILWFSLRY
jgi:hypothetical protein